MTKDCRPCTSLNIGEYEGGASRVCCDTDLCNVEQIPPVKYRSLKCYTCTDCENDGNEMPKTCPHSDAVHCVVSSSFLSVFK